jgi:hypothetical protein
MDVVTNLLFIPLCNPLLLFARVNLMTKSVPKLTYKDKGLFWRLETMIHNPVALGL